MAKPSASATRSSAFIFALATSLVRSLRVMAPSTLTYSAPRASIALKDTDLRPKPSIISLPPSAR